jgi:hypothetical protein
MFSVSRPVDRDPVLMLVFWGGYAVILAIIFYVALKWWFWGTPR